MKKLFYVFVFVIVGIAQQSVSVAQSKKIDSLWAIYKNKAEADTARLKATHAIANMYLYNNPDTCIIIAEQELKLAQQTKQRKYEGNALNIIAVSYLNKGNYPEALKNHFVALKLRVEIKDKKGIASSYINIGVIYMYQGNYPEALKNYFAALGMFEEIKNKNGIATSNNNIGNIYYLQGNYPEALKYYFITLKIKLEINNKQDISSCYNNIGLVYNDQGNYPEALKMHQASLKLREEIGDKHGISFSYFNIGVIYEKQNKYPEALKMYLTALKIKEEIGDKDGVAATFKNLGFLYIKLHKTKEAQDYLDRALQLSLEIGSKETIKGSYQGLAVMDSITGNYKAAFAHHKLFITYRDSLNNEETKKKSLQASMQYEFDKKEIATKAEQDKLDAINAEEKKKQQIVIYAVAGLLVLVGVFAVFMFNRFKITQRQKTVIEEQKEQVDKAYEELHEKNKEVMDSIRYAKRIQTALITPEKYINNTLNRLKKNN